MLFTLRREDKGHREETAREEWHGNEKMAMLSASTPRESTC